MYAYYMPSSSLTHVYRVLGSRKKEGIGTTRCAVQSGSMEWLSVSNRFFLSSQGVSKF